MKARRSTALVVALALMLAAIVAGSAAAAVASKSGGVLSVSFSGANLEAGAPTGVALPPNDVGPSSNR